MGSGFNIQAIAADIMSKYDHNNNGVIDLQKTSNSKVGRFFEQIETRRTDTDVYGTDNVNVSTMSYSQEKLFRAADKNNDMRVTREELIDTIKTFDKNNDGELSNENIFKRITGKKGEYQHFDKNFGETLSNYSHVRF